MKYRRPPIIFHLDEAEMKLRYIAHTAFFVRRTGSPLDTLPNLPQRQLDGLFHRHGATLQPERSKRCFTHPRAQTSPTNSY